MPTTSDAKLTRKVTIQSEKINYLTGRLSDLVDEIHLLRSELANFKEDVASDVTYLTSRVDTKQD